MNPSDRLQARSLLLDEVFAAKSKAEYERDQALQRVAELEAQLAATSEPATPAV